MEMILKIRLRDIGEELKPSSSEDFFAVTTEGRVLRGWLEDEVWNISDITDKVTVEVYVA